MKRTFLLGAAVTVIGGAGLWVASLLSIDLSNTIMGIGAGVAVGVVPDRNPLLRLVGLLIGLVLGVALIAMRLGALPGGQSVAGAVITLVIVMLVMTLISGLSAGHVPAWTIILGILSFVAGFGSIAQETPWISRSELPGAFTNIVAMSLLGYLIVFVATLLPDGRSDVPTATQDPPAGPPPPEYPASGEPSDAVGLDDMMRSRR